MVQQVVAASKDESWRLGVLDIVYIGEGSKPHRIFRIGFGQYEKEVRVARLHEDISQWSTG
eukprot:11166881-Karenia_brevis.AAC.1